MGGNYHTMGSSSMLADAAAAAAYQAEKSGILKKPGPYGPMDAAALEKEKWLEETERLSRLDRISTSSQNQLIGDGRGMHQPHDARSLSEAERTLKNLNGYHEGILEALRTAATNTGKKFD